MPDEKKRTLLRAAEVSALEETGAHPWNPNSQLRGTRLGVPCGLKRTGVNLMKVAPHKESFILHAHHLEEEWVYVLSGRGIAEIDGKEYEVGPGDFMGFATPQVAHHLRNPFDEELVYLTGGENREVEIADFPKQGRRMIREGSKVQIYRLEDAEEFGPL